MKSKKYEDGMAARTPWETHEKDLLFEAMELFGPSDPSRLAEYVGSRNTQQVRAFLNNRGSLAALIARAKAESGDPGYGGVLKHILIFLFACIVEIILIFRSPP